MTSPSTARRSPQSGRYPNAAGAKVDAAGRHVIPGWVDIHTHYDGQVTWDPQVTPSSWHGTTTVVMGNCGVGFAPVRRGAENFLIELMEGVEDIPGTALHEGIDWQWETFPEYLDALDRMPRVLDVVAQLPHAALRAYVMGERAHEDPTADDVAVMAKLVEEALTAGAAGFTTSRTILHRSRHGLVPGTSAPPDELVALGEAMARAGHGVLEMVSDHTGTEEEREWMVHLAQLTGVTVSYALAQVHHDPTVFRAAVEDAARLAEDRGVGRAAGVVPTDRDAVRPAVVAPPVHHPSHLPLDLVPAPGGAGGPASAPRGARAPCCPSRRIRGIRRPGR